MDEQRPAKRARLEAADGSAAADVRAKRAAFLSSLSRPVSPPKFIKETSTQRPQNSVPSGLDPSISLESKGKAENQDQLNGPKKTTLGARNLPSPIQLTRVRGLSAQDNDDTISLHNILGDPLIKEAWIFNFCFDVGWTMRHFDADVRSLVKVKIVHGSWKREDGNRQGIEEDMKIWKNVEEIRAYLPDPFGTHHSKMIILFKHDSTAQVIIHTANMLEKDWDHMTQAVWRSPVLPWLEDTSSEADSSAPVGSGARFKADLLRYTKAYGGKLRLLFDQLNKYDFSEVRAALIGSVPSYTKLSDPNDKVWGHLSLRRALEDLETVRRRTSPLTPNRSHVISQISSIATLPQSFLQDTLYKAASPSTTSIIYPTPSDLRTALTGYATGGSIHTKISTAANQKQISLLRPQLHRWGTQSSNPNNRAGRHMIPPHIKTYISFTSKPTSENPTPDINWAILTSANLSQQAWGTIPKLPKNSRDQEDAVVHIQSFEIGVLVWPELFVEETEHNAEDLDEKEKTTVRMVPVFGKDLPESINRIQSQSGKEVLVGLRMPYDLPLTPYGPDEMPWSPGESYAERDRLGNTWPP